MQLLIWLVLKLQKFHKICKKINSETIITNEYDQEIPKKRYISIEERQKLLIIWDQI